MNFCIAISRRVQSPEIKKKTATLRDKVNPIVSFRSFFCFCFCFCCVFVLFFLLSLRLVILFYFFFPKDEAGRCKERDIKISSVHATPLFHARIKMKI